MMPALHSMEPSVSCLEALQLVCCDEASGTDLLRCQSVELFCAPDTGVTAVLHSKLCLRVGPEVFDEENTFQAVTASNVVSFCLENYIFNHASANVHKLF